MKKLYLVRHAKSSWDNPSLNDFDRPLNGRGRKDVPRMGAWLKKQGIVPDIILSSPALRAITTARKLIATLGLGTDVLVTDKRLYLASPEEMINVVSEKGGLSEEIFLVGHNPGHTDLANSLSQARIDNLPTGAVFAVQFNINSWSELRTHTGDFLFFQYPKNLIK